MEKISKNSLYVISCLGLLGGNNRSQGLNTLANIVSPGNQAGGIQQVAGLLGSGDSTRGQGVLNSILSAGSAVQGATGGSGSNPLSNVASAANVGNIVGTVTNIFGGAK
jgi:hypothetical protein